MSVPGAAELDCSRSLFPFEKIPFIAAVPFCLCRSSADDAEPSNV